MLVTLSGQRINHEIIPPMLEYVGRIDVAQ